MATTPTSATGSSAERGFTLVELVVTIAIVAALGTAVMLAMPDPYGALREDGERLAARLALARDAAIVGGRDVALRIDAQGYGFEMRRAGTWMAADGSGLRPGAWPAGAGVATLPSELKRIAFDATGLATPAAVTLTRDGRTVSVRVEAAGTVRVDAR